MHPFHILLAAVNIACLFAILFSDHIGSALSTNALPLGFFANATAIIVGVAVLLTLVFSAFRNKASAVFAKHWLALVNGTIVLSLWLAFAYFLRLGA